jgi:hypothetical protein
MKKLIIAALMVAAVTVSAFAADGSKKVNYKVLDNFKQEFAYAKDVQWTIGSEFTKANFTTLEGQKAEAFYTLQGERIAVSKAVTLDKLPTVATKTIAQKYATYTTTEAIELENEENTKFYVSLDNGVEKIILEVSKDGGVSVFKKVKK